MLKYSNLKFDFSKDYRTMDMPIDIRYENEDYEIELGLDQIDNVVVGLSRIQLENLRDKITEYLER